MTKHFGFQKMDAYKVARQLAVEVHRGKISHKELRDQAERAAVGAFRDRRRRSLARPAASSEGLPNDSVAMRRRHFTIARNSLCELVAAVDLASALGVLNDAAAKSIEQLAASLRAMLIALMR